MKRSRDVAAPTRKETQIVICRGNDETLIDIDCECSTGNEINLRPGKIIERQISDAAIDEQPRLEDRVLVAPEQRERQIRYVDRVTGAAKLEEDERALLEHPSSEAFTDDFGRTCELSHGARGVPDLEIQRGQAHSNLSLHVIESSATPQRSTQSVPRGDVVRALVGRASNDPPRYGRCLLVGIIHEQGGTPPCLNRRGMNKIKRLVRFVPCAVRFGHRDRSVRAVIRCITDGDEHSYQRGMPTRVPGS